MTLKFHHNNPLYLATLFTSLLREDISPDQIMIGIIQLANDIQDSHGINASVECLRCILGPLYADTSAEGVSAFILSLAPEGVTTLMLLDALKIACCECGLLDTVNILQLTRQKLEAEIGRQC